MDLQGKNIADYSTVKHWLTKLRKKGDKPNTRRAYLKALKDFCVWAGLAPDELIDRRKRDLDEKERALQRRAEDLLDSWFGVLSKMISNRTSRPLSRNTCVLRYNAIRSFYKANYYELEVDDAPAAWNEKAKPEMTLEHYAELQEAVTLPMHKAYILCQVQSGLSVSDLCKLTLSSSEASIFGNLGHQLDEGADHVHLRIQRTKQKKVGHFDSFFGRLATEALREWLQEQGSLRLSSQLFPCTCRNINKFLERASCRAGLPWKITSHNLRMYFSTRLKMTRVNDPAFNDTLIEYWMGHSLGRVQRAYMVPPVLEQMRLYKLAETRLEPTF